MVGFVLAALALGSGPAAAQEPPALDSQLATAESVWIESEATRHSGHLLKPAGAGPHPAVVFLEGSGDASYRFSWMPDYFPFWRDIADSFLDRGYAVLLFDKAGVNESTGDWRRQSFDARAEEAMAAVQYLSSRPDVDPARIGLAGHSQGGWIAQMAGARAADEVAFLVLLAGPAVSVRQQIRDDVESGWRCDGIAGVGWAVRQAGLRVGLSVLSLVSRVVKVGYLSRIIHYDPGPDLSEIRQPTLAIFGEHDPLVLPESNRIRLERYFGGGEGIPPLAIHTVPGADHFFRASAPCPTGERPREWAPEFFASLEDPAYWAWVEGEGGGGGEVRGPMTAP